MQYLRSSRFRTVGRTLVNAPLRAKQLAHLAWSLLDNTVVRRVLPRLVSAERRLALLRDLGKLALLRRLRHRPAGQVSFRVVATTEPGLFRFVSVPRPEMELGLFGLVSGSLASDDDAVPVPNWAGLEAELAAGRPLRIVWDHSRVAQEFCYAPGWLSHAGDLCVPAAAVYSLDGLAALARRDPALVVLLLRRAAGQREEPIDEANARFWNEMCGTGLANLLGLPDQSRESLRRFDQAFFELYPYLLPMLRPERLAGRRVLEVGLGYGSLGQKLAEAAGHYTGLDIAAKPVEMMNARLRWCGRPGRAVQGSAYNMPFADGSFDFVVSIGCFHHTGNLQGCLDETYRVLAPGGSAFIMVYNKFGLRQWLRWPKETIWSFVEELFGPAPASTAEDEDLRRLTREFLAKVYRCLTQTDTPTEQVGPALQALIGIFCGKGRPAPRLSEECRYAYDHNQAGVAAPETVLCSVGELRRRLHRFERVTFSKRNADPLVFKGKTLIDRDDQLETLSRVLGLDIYFEARKGDAHEVRHAA
jgi:SAM-dependent methyltransferase